MIVDTDATQIESSSVVIIAGRSYPISDGAVLGREGTIARSELAELATVSRRHAIFTKREGKWYVTVPSSVANSTRLDGVEIRRDAPQLLLGRHVLALSQQAVARIEI